MIICKYTKLDSARFFSHLDFMRQIDMAIRRTELPVNYSHGFNPHSLLYFAPPLPVGVASSSEYLCIDIDICANDFLGKINKSLAKGIKILKAANCEKNPNVAAISRAATYKIKSEKSVELEDFKKLNSKKEIVISFESKGKLVSKDIKDKIFELKGEGDTYEFTLACGNNNLRADRLFNQLLENSKQQTNFIVEKKKLFTFKSALNAKSVITSTKQLVEVDKLFFG